MEPLKIIKHALDSTIELINNGEKPTSALEKVARELDLNPNYIQRTGEALNVALFYGHMKSASDKAADFDMGDIQEITKRIFGETEKTLAQKRAEWFPAAPVDINYNKLVTDPKYKRAAAAIASSTENYDSFGVTYKGQFKKAVDYLSRLDREVDEIKTEKVANDIYIEAAFSNLISGFKKEASARTAFHEFESQAFAEHGERARPYLDLLYKSAGLQEARGANDAAYINYTPCRELEVFNSFLKAAKAKAEHDINVKEAEEHIVSERTKFKQAGYRLNPLAQIFDKNDCAALDEYLEKEAGIGDIGSSLVQDFISKFNNSSSGKPVFGNSKIDNRERMAILQELIMTDDILKKQDPRKIIQAYQQVLRLAPQISKEKEVVRAKLREMMAGQALHPTDANQLVEANTNLMQQHQMLRQIDDSGKKDKKK
jgi:hypothetical protein